MAGEIPRYQSGNISVPAQHPPIGHTPTQTSKHKWEWQDPVVGPYFFIQEDQVVTVPQNRQYLLSGDLELEGEIIINGEMVLL